MRCEEIRVGIGRSTKHRQPVTRSAALGQRVTEVVVRFRVIRPDREGLPIIGHGFIEAPRAIEGEATIVVGEVVVVRYGQRMIEKGEGIFPNAKLTPSPQDTGGQYRDGAESENWPRGLREKRKERELQTQDRQVSVTIGHVMQTNLHESEHRQEHDEEPEPTNRQPWTIAKLNQSRSGHQDEKQNRCANNRRRPKARMRIKNCQIVRPKKFFEIADNGHEGVGDSGVKRQHR